MSSILFSKSIRVNDAISILVPTVGDILDNEDTYFDLVFSIIATPYDMMVQLDDAGIDFTKITEFDLFMLLFRSLQNKNTSLIFGDLDLSKFQITKTDQQNGSFVLQNPETGVIIDEGTHAFITHYLRLILNIERNDKKPGNEDARLYMIRRAREKQKRRKRKQQDSRLESYIVALVNTPEFPYDYETVKTISIYQFYASLKQVSHKIKYDNTMHGYYAGTIKFEDLKKGDKSWIQTD